MSLSLSEGRKEYKLSPISHTKKKKKETKGKPKQTLTIVPLQTNS